MTDLTNKINKNIFFCDKMFLYLSLVSLFIFSRRNIYWQGAATFSALFFILIGLAFFILKNKNNISISFASILVLFASTFFYFISKKYNIFSYIDYAKIVLSVLVFIYGCLLFRKYGKSISKSIFLFILHLLFFSAAISLFYFFLYSKDPIVFDYITFPFISNGVIMGPWGYSNTFAIFMVLGVFISQFFSLENMENSHFEGTKISIFLSKYFYDMISAFFISILFITTSRFSIFIFIILWIFYIILILLLKDKYKKTIILKIIFISVLSFFMILISVQANSYILKFSQQKIQTLISSFTGGKKEYSGATRLYLIKFSFQEFFKNKLFGNGFGSFGFLLRKFTQNADFEKLIDPHSFFAKLLFESGILGIITIFSPILFILFNKIIYTFRKKNFSNEFVIVLGSIAVFAHMNVDMDFVFPIALFVFMLVLSLFDGNIFLVKINNKIFLYILIIFLVLSSIIIFPKAISCSLLLRKNMNYVNYEPSTLLIAKKLFPQNLYISETIGENESNRILVNVEPSDKFVQAISFYNSYANVLKDDYFPYFNSGILLFNLGNKEAVNKFEISSKLAPMIPETNAWYSFSRNIFYNDISENNVEYAQKSLDISSSCFSGHLFFANYFRITGQIEKMIVELRFLKAYYPFEGLPYYIEYLYYKSMDDMLNAGISFSKAGNRNFDISRFEKGLN